MNTFARSRCRHTWLRRRSAVFGFAILLAGGLAGISCRDGAPIGPGSVAAVTVTPETVTLTVGQTIQLTAAPRDADGVAFSGPTVSWESSDILVAVVSNTGLLSATGPGTAIVSATVQGKTAAAAVTATLQPAIGLSVTDVSFLSAQGGGDPPSQYVVIRNAGGGAFANLGIGAIVYNDGEPHGWLSTALNGNEDTLTVRSSISGLGVGTYQARVPIIVDGASNSPFNFVATLTVSDVLELLLSASHLDFSALSGTANPPAQTIQVSDLGGGAVTAAAIDTVIYNLGSDWLTVTAANGTITVQPEITGLSVGVYSATVRVSAPGAANTPSFTVSFTVSTTPQIILTPVPVNFSAIIGDPDPPQQTVTVSSAGTGDLGTIALGAVSYGAGQPNGWLSVSLADSIVTLQASLGALADGAYSAMVPVTATLAGNSPQNIPVTFVVGTAPAIGLSSGTVVISAQEASGIDAADTVTVTNIGGGTLDGLMTGNVVYGSGQPTGWLTASLNGPTAPAQLVISGAPGVLVPGSYSATVDVSDADASNSPLTVNVSFTVTAAPRIASSDTSIDFNAVEMGSNPSSQAITITNSGAAPLDPLSVGTIAYGSGSGWLSANLNTANAPATLTVQPTTGTLAPGTYAATVPIVSANAINTPHNISVTFTVAALDPQIAFSDTTVDFITTLGVDPAGQTVDVINAGGGTLDNLALGAVSYGASQPTGWLAPVLNGTQVQLGVSVTALPTGSYDATVPVTSTSAVNSPQSLVITLTVEDEPQISLSSNSLSFSATVGGGNPGAQTVVVTNVGGGTINGLRVDSITYPSNPGWAAASIVGSSIQVQPTTGVLPAAVYDATIWVGSDNANNAPTIGVTFTIQAAGTPLIALTPSTLNPFTTVGTTDPAPDTVNITNGGTGTLSGLAVEPIVYGSGSGWLTANLGDSTTAPSAVELQATLGALVAGTYTATVPISSAVPGVATQNINVSFTVYAATGTKLSITTQPPASASNANAFVTQPAVQIVNAVDVPIAQAGVTVNALIQSQPGVGATLQNASAVTNASGLAIFSGLGITGPTGAYTLRFTSTGLTAVVSGGINVTAGAPSTATSSVTASPTSVVADGASISTVTVALLDVSGNPLTIGGNAVGVSTNAGSVGGVTDNGNGTYTSTFTAPTSSGTATITATVGGNTIADNATIALTPGPASAATSIISAAPTSITANGAATSTITVQLFDANNNQLTSGGDAVLLSTNIGSLSGVNDLGNGQYQSTLTSSTSVGIATVTGTVNAAGITDNATVSFVAGGASTIEAASATSLVGTVNTVVTPTPTVLVTDGNGNPVQGVNVTFNPVSGGVSQTTVSTNGSGTASTTWTLGATAGNQTLTATAAGLSGSPVTFTATANAGIASQIVITQGPTSAQAGVAFTPAFVVQIQDQFGNNVAAAHAVTASLQTGSPTLFGTLTRSTSALTGDVTFSGLYVGGVTGSRSVRFASGSLTPAISNAFNVGTGPASKLAVTTHPSNVTSNLNFSTVGQLRDQYDNNVFASGVSVTLSKSTGSGTLTGTTVASTNILGTVSFTNARITGTTTGFGSHRLQLSSTGLTSVLTNTFTVAVSFSYNVQPIFTSNCALSGCHNGTTSPNLTAGLAYGQTVNIASLCTAGTRIVPGNAATSVLMLRMNGGSCGVMPPTGVISATLRTIVQTWINEGASNN